MHRPGGRQPREQPGLTPAAYLRPGVHRQLRLIARGHARRRRHGHRRQQDRFGRLQSRRDYEPRPRRPYRKAPTRWSPTGPPSAARPGTICNRSLTFEPHECSMLAHLCEALPHWANRSVFRPLALNRSGRFALRRSRESLVTLGHLPRRQREGPGQ